MSYLLHSLWQTIALALGAGAALGLARKQPAALRHGIAFAALLLAVVLPLLPGRVVRVAPAAPIPAAPMPLPAAKAASAVRIPAPASAPTPARRLPIAPLLLLAWAALGLAHLAALARGWRRTLRLVRSAAPWGTAGGVAVLHSPQAPSPFTAGWLRPVIVLPDALLGRPQLIAAALAHELAHVRRGDFFWAWLGEAAFAPLAYHPAAHWLRRQAGAAREMACDEAASARVPEYPRALVEIAALACGRTPALAGLFLTAARDLERRVHWLRATPARSRVLAPLAAGLLALSATAAWGLNRQQTPTQKVPPRPVAVGGSVQEAICLECPRPRQYPAEARAAGVQGPVEMLIVIQADGTPLLGGCEAGNPLLLAAAEDTVRAWRFRPLRLNGVPQAINSTITVDFTLPGARPPAPLPGFRGVVCDGAGARVPGATVTAANIHVPPTTTRSDAVGAFRLALPDGTYAVTVSEPGFQSQQFTVALPQPGERLIQLQIGAASQTVEFSGGGPRR